VIIATEEQLVWMLDKANDDADAAYTNYDIETFEAICARADRIWKQLSPDVQWAYTVASI